MSSSASRPVRPDGFSKEKKKWLLASKKNGVFTHLVGDTAKFKLSKPCALDVQIEVHADDTSRGGLILSIAFPLREDSWFQQSRRVFAASLGQGWVSLSGAADPEAKGTIVGVAPHLRKALVVGKSSEDNDVGVGPSPDEGKEATREKKTAVVASTEDDKL